MACIAVEQVTKIYDGAERVKSLDRVSFTVEPGELAAVIGPSGSGKSTLMHLIGCMDRPTAGRIRLNDVDISRIDERQVVPLRRQIGFVFQQFHLVPELTAAENVALPLYYRGISPAKRRGMAMDALKAVGLADRAAHLPRELSGGQQQRVALARATVVRPSIVLADEPTGNLDPAAGADVMRLLRSLCRSGVTVLLITHDSGIAAAAPRRLILDAGRLVADERSPAEDMSESRALRRWRRAHRAIMHQYGFRADHVDFLPSDNRVVIPPEQAEQFGAPVDNQRNKLSGTGVDLHIVHIAQPLAVADVDDFFIVKRGDATKHENPSLTFRFINRVYVRKGARMPKIGFTTDFSCVASQKRV